MFVYIVLINQSNKKQLFFYFQLQNLHVSSIFHVEPQHKLLWFLLIQFQTRYKNYITSDENQIQFSDNLNKFMVWKIFIAIFP